MSDNHSSDDFAEHGHDPRIAQYWDQLNNASVNFRLSVTMNVAELIGNILKWIPLVILGAVVAGWVAFFGQPGKVHAYKDENGTVHMWKSRSDGMPSVRTAAAQYLDIRAPLTLREVGAQVGHPAGSTRTAMDRLEQEWSQRSPAACCPPASRAPRGCGWPATATTGSRATFTRTGYSATVGASPPDRTWWTRTGTCSWPSRAVG
ncbi:hypothetical protein NKG94_21260 [Micromonospora sp. M12]